MRGVAWFLATTAAACGGGGDEGPRGVVLEVPECQGAPLLAMQGQHPMLVSSLSIGAQADGFDLDGDGQKDNKLAGLAGIARQPIADAFARRDLIVPLELGDTAALGPDSCVKVAFYLGRYKLDRDGDGKVTSIAGGDCDDHEAAVAPGHAEVAGNGRDDDCDGLADEGGPADDLDRDHDGVTVAGGDCDDEQPAVKKGAAEVCGDGRDNDCDGLADGCDPFDTTPEEIAVDPLSLDGSKPRVLFGAGAIGAGGVLEAGPAFFSVSVPVTAEISLDLRISGARLRGPIDERGLHGARLGGILAGHTLDELRGLSVPLLSLGPEDSLLDAIFANALGVALALPRHPSGCFSPDIDVDGDGREAFCDTKPDDDKLQVDLCIDGDGTEVRDGAEQCTAARDGRGARRFVDGISVALVFDAVPSSKLIPIPER